MLKIYSKFAYIKATMMNNLKENGISNIISISKTNRNTPSFSLTENEDVIRHMFTSLEHLTIKMFSFVCLYIKRIPNNLAVSNIFITHTHTQTHTHI